MSSCLPTPSSSSSSPAYTLSASTQLPTTGPYSSSTRNAFVRRNGTRLEVEVNVEGGGGVQEFKIVGPNVYWLGLDENVDPNPSYPTKGRVLEAMAIASVMGATTIRSQSFGISVGTGLSIENALNTFKPEGDAAWDALDFAVYAARQYNLRLILPLTDSSDYYHGGAVTFLRWRNLSDSDFSPFYDTMSAVYSDFTNYIRTLLTHVSPYTNLSLSTDPTILAFETGNELGGWTGKDYPPPVEWTTSIAKLLKELAPRTLVVSGSYGVRKDELGIGEVDIHSDHFYPLYTSRLSHSASLAHSHNKPFLAGEYDWTNSLYNKLRWAWWAMVIPVVVAAIVAWTGCGPRRWWPVRTTLRGVFTCGGCGKGRRNRRRRRREKPAAGVNGGEEEDGEREEAPPPPALPLHVDLTDEQQLEGGQDKSLFASSTSTLPILSSSASTASTTFPPSPSPSHTPRQSTSASWLDRPFLLRKWHLSLLLLLFLPLLGALLHVYLPSSITSFLSTLSDLTTSPSEQPRAVGDLYWSLFGRDSSCCTYVQHHDGYTVHFPSDPSNPSSFSSSEGVLRLTKHAWGVRGERPFWLAADGREVKELRVEDLPVVKCPQEGVRVGNGTVVGEGGG